jgi:hypothetical protein
MSRNRSPSHTIALNADRAIVALESAKVRTMRNKFVRFINTGEF